MSAPEGPPPCLARWFDAKSLPLPALGDEEGERLPQSLPDVVDAHVHLFPDRLFEAIWQWFDQHAWPVRYRLHSERVVDFLLARGVKHLVALHYAHKGGIARGLNAYMAELCRSRPRVLGVATVFPGERGAREILKDAFALGLRGVKLHCHVQCFSPDAAALHEVYETCVEQDQVLIMHAGREPSMPQYRCDPYQLCSAESVERVLTDHPKLKLVVPHLGANEYDAYERLLARFDNLWLDTTMAAADYFPGGTPRRLIESRPERILYGTDFPNLPYAWDREVKALHALGLPEAAEAQVLGGTARRLFGLD